MKKGDIVRATKVDDEGMVKGRIDDDDTFPMNQRGVMMVDGQRCYTKGAELVTE